MSEGTVESGHQLVLDCGPGVIGRIERTAASRGLSVEQHLKDSVATGAWAAESEAEGAELYVLDGQTLVAFDWPEVEKPHA